MSSAALPQRADKSPARPLSLPIGGTRSAPARDDSTRDPLDLGLLPWLFGYTRPYAAKRNGLLVLVIIRAIQLPLLAWCMGQVINGPISGHSATGLFWGTLTFLALSATTHLTYHFRQRWALELGEGVVHDLRNEIFAHLQRMPLAYFRDTPVGRLISRVTSDAESVRAGVQDVLFTSLVGVGQMLVAAALMFYADWVLALLVTAMLPVMWIINRHFRARLSTAYRAMQESFSRVTSSVTESIQGIQVIQGAAREQTTSRLFRNLVANHSRYNLEAARTSGLFFPLLEFHSQLFVAMLLLVGGFRVLAAPTVLPPGELIQFLFLANIFFQPIQMLGDQFNQAMMAMAGAERVRQLLATEPPANQSAAASQPTLVGGIRFENVNFAYQPGRTVLKEVSLDIRPGQVAALIGPTGSGKSTLLNLIAKFHLPSSGRLLVDGLDIWNISTHAYHRQTALVHQQNFLFSGSVRDNIRFGRPEASDAEVSASLEQLGCRDLFDSLPQRLETDVGEGGGNLSLGQRQLVCFARALLANPRILLLDEATSSIDVFTEHRIQQALAALLKGRTCVVVAHRLSTIRNADVIFVIEQGRIARSGPPAEILGDQPRADVVPRDPRPAEAA